MRTLLLVLGFFVGIQEGGVRTVAAEGLHQYTVKDIGGQPVDLSRYKGSVVLVANTASQCGYTPQYADLEKVFNDYKERGFVVLAFPSNDFGGQEPKGETEIAKFCEQKFGITFPLFEKTKVTGDEKSEVFSYLTRTENRSFAGEVRWNFEKFLVDRNGILLERFRSNVNPAGQEIRGAIEQELSQQ